MIGRWILVSIAVAGASCASARARPGRNQEVEWFRSGPYIGASVGVSNSAASASDLDADLAALGHTSSSTLDDTNEGWKFYTGYRFERPFSIEVGYVQLDSRGAELLFQVLTEREEKSSIGLASNLPFSEWGQIITDARLVAAVIDRITFNAHIIETGTESYRHRTSRTRRPRTPRDG